MGTESTPSQLRWTGDASSAVLVDEPVAHRLSGAAVRRWGLLGVFVVVSALNFLDRQLLAAVAPTLRSEFGLSNADYGAIVAAFSMTCTLAAPVAGWFVDRVGLRLGVVATLGFWSLAGIATAFAGTYRGLLGCRMALGASEAAGIPAASKSVAVFLEPREFGLGIAVNNLGVMAGLMGAPLLAALVAPVAGWRAAFVITGALGFVWLPVIWLTSSRADASVRPATDGALPLRELLRDRRLWRILAANVFVMANYALWLNWTTIYFVEHLGLTQNDANRYYAWIPPMFATLGAFAGGWLGFRRVGTSHGATAAASRLRLCCLLSPALLVTAFVPLLHDPALATVAICASVFA